MQVKIKSTRLELTDAIRQYIETKMGMVEKYLGTKVKVTNCDFEIEKAVGGQNKGEIFRAEVNLEVPHEILRVEKTEKDLYKAIDKVKDHLELIIKKYKGKLIDKRRGK
ncbi:MAG TPA: ribosome-associated translation inhibitor RaiA [Candidatus Saccharimonadales bacterium]|nr:ribosome-associated translation inhibitor RaiA [Candidatus Saccharimonadales bacterium]